MDKKRLAEAKRKERATMDPLLKERYDQSIRNQLLTMTKDLKTVALFASFNDEINLFPLMDVLWEKGKTVYLPKVEGKTMNFYEVNSKDDLIKSKMGILEPKQGRAVSKEAIDLIVVPMLVYNTDKYRIGYGGGYYDGYLHDYSGLKVGVAYSFQFTDKEFVEKHDVACDYIITERGME